MGEPAGFALRGGMKGTLVKYGNLLENKKKGTSRGRCPNFSLFTVKLSFDNFEHHPPVVC
jgi:hypothetical protein